MALTQVPNAMLSTDLQGVTPGFKNRFINGAMGIWQRGTSYSPGSYYQYGGADRWCNNSVSTAYARSTDVPSGFTYSTSITGTSAAYPGIAQRIESLNCVDLVGQTITVSAYIKKSTGTGAVNCALFYANSSDNFGGLTSIGDVVLTSSPTSSYVRYSATFTNLPAGAANGLQVSIYTASASNSDVMLITGVQLEKGSTATSFDYRPYGTELQLCQRYYERSYDIGSTTGSFGNGWSGFATGTSSIGEVTPNIIFKVTKRAGPTVVGYNAVSGASNAVYRVSDATSVGINYLNYIGTNQVGLINLVSGSSNSYFVSWTASAEL